jgi:hypothetical protein
MHHWYRKSSPSRFHQLLKKSRLWEVLAWPLEIVSGSENANPAVRRKNFYETANDRKKFWMNAIFSTPKEKLPSQKQSTYIAKATPMTKFKDEQSFKNPSSDLS